MGIGTSSSSSGASAPRANAYAVNRDASELRRSPARKAPDSAQPGPMHVIYMSVHTGIQAAHRTDSHGHCPQNRLTCANQQAEPCTPSASSQGERAPRQGRRTTHRRRLSPIPTRPRHYPPTPDTRTPQADGALALPAKPARQRPADRAGDPDRPAMYPGGTWHPPPVDLRRHRASPSDHADASDSAEMSTSAVRIPMHEVEYSLTLSRPCGRWLWSLLHRSGRKSDRVCAGGLLRERADRCIDHGRFAGRPSHRYRVQDSRMSLRTVMMVSARSKKASMTSSLRS